MWYIIMYTIHKTVVYIVYGLEKQKAYLMKTSEKYVAK